MINFTIKRSLFQFPSSKCYEELKKIDKFIEILQKSGINEIIERVNKNNKQRKGRASYNPYNLMAKERNIVNYLKFHSWNGESSGKKPQLFFIENNVFRCLNNIIGIDRLIYSLNSFQNVNKIQN